MTYGEHMQQIVSRYVGAGQPWPATSRQIARWAIREGLWEPQPSSLVAQCATELARAMREEYTVDPQGRAVRTKHAATVLRDGVQLTLWADIRTADREHMRIAFQQRRQQILGDCRQLKLDADSYNENVGTTQAPIQIVFDFRDDLAEDELLARGTPIAA